MTVRFVMIAYVNRSGSTFLSRLLSDNFNDVFVFPELGFPLKLIFEHSQGRTFSGDELYEVIAADPRIDSLHLDEATLRLICARSESGDLRAFFIRLAEASGRRSGYRAIVFKLESLLFLHGSIIRIFPELKVVHLVRDPRAVANSMLNTAVPEKPGFNMARGSVVYAATHWRDYVRHAEKVGESHPVLTIKFESLGKETDSVLDLISDEIELDRAPSADPGSRYAISKIDADLHPHVFDTFMDQRSVAWKRDLPARSLRIIEAICGKEMQRYGYGLAVHDGPVRRPELAYAYAMHGFRMLKHSTKTLAIYARRDDRFAAVIDRARIYARQSGWGSSG